jgi:hypothetical protein
MSRPRVHKNRILRLVTKLREEVSILYEEHHVEFPNKDINGLELDMNDLCREIERMELSK